MSKLAHPYEGFRGSSLWKRIDRAVLDLVTDQDIRLKTRRQYVVGYICYVLTHRPRRRKTRNGNAA
jgi:hypothetical protein